MSKPGSAFGGRKSLASAGGASTTSSGAAVPVVVPETLYKEFGRDTPAGRALFALYNKNKVAYSPNVKLSLTNKVDPHAEHEAKRKAAAAAKKKPVFVSDTMPREPVVAPPSRFQLYGGKKRATEIASQMKTDFARPEPTKMGYIEPREKRIERLQNRFANPNEKTAAPKPLKAAPAAPLSPSRSMNPNQALFAAIVKEIDERKRFLDEMKSSGALTRDVEASVKAEIAERLRELKAVDALIKAEIDDRKAAEAASESAAAAGGDDYPAAAAAAPAAGGGAKSSIDKTVPKTKKRVSVTAARTAKK